MDYPPISHHPRLNRLRAWRGCGLLVLLWLSGRGLRLFGLRRLHRKTLAWCVRRTRLFDPDFYLAHNEDVAAASWDPLRHYVIHGSRERRAPCPLFDPVYYRGQVKSRLTGINTLLHYQWVGRYLGYSPSAHFDLPYYLAHNKDVARRGVDPLRHYLTHGRWEGRMPSPLAADEPSDFLIGHDRARPFPQTPVPLPRPLPAPETFKTPDDMTPIDVIVPVYRGFAETRRCIESVLAAPNMTRFELIVIDDASPEPELSAWLQSVADSGCCTLLRNLENLGFVATANRGLELHPERDKVLLNSDTEVYGNWLDRLRRHSRVPACGTLTPLTSNGTLCSYPHTLRDNPYPLELSWAALDALCAELNADLRVETPTGVGFCLYITAACIAATGLFDVAAFGHGYGEENDFCLRARTLGFRNFLVSDIFVHHLGSVSFQGTRGPRVQRALKVLNQRYPGYDREIRDFISRDPLLDARRALDWGRLRRHRRDQNVLMLCHRRGGGSERRALVDATEQAASGLGVFYLRPDGRHGGLVRWSGFGITGLPNLAAQLFADTQGLLAGIQDLGITRIHDHGLVDYGQDAHEYLLQLLDAAKLPLWREIHDYTAICPQINLTDDSGIYCGEPAEEACNRCLSIQKNSFRARDIGKWRDRQHTLLRRATRIRVPDLDVAMRLARYFPDLQFEVCPHEPSACFDNLPSAPVIPHGTSLHIVIPGAIGRIKGFDVLLACARDARRRALPVRFTVLGYTQDDPRLVKEGVTVTGRYHENEAMNQLTTLRAHAAWLPTVCPETYSYTLSLALKAGLPVFAFELGAIASRLRALDRANHLMPLALAGRPQEINQRFVDFRTQMPLLA